MRTEVERLKGSKVERWSGNNTPMLHDPEAGRRRQPRVEPHRRHPGSEEVVISDPEGVTGVPAESREGVWGNPALRVPSAGAQRRPKWGSGTRPRAGSGAAALGFCCLALLLNSCTVGPDTKSPLQAPSLPEKFAAGASEGEMNRDWWQDFHEPELSRLIELGLKDNPGLRAAAQRVLAARYDAASLNARGEPEISARAGFQRQGNSQEKAFRMPTPVNNWSGAFDFSWDLDLWGAALRVQQGAEALAQASAADEAGARLALAAEIGRVYFEQRSAGVELAEVEINLGQQAEILALAQSRFDAGLSDEAPLLDAKRRLASYQSELAALRLRQAQAQHALMQLCATTELPLLKLANSSGEIPVFPVGQPASLLRRRPDILAAEARLRSALAQQGVDEAELYPQFSLTGSLGREATNLGDLKKSTANAWSIGPSVRWQLFNRSSLHRRVDAAGARAKAAEADWEDTWRRALREVEDALSAVEQQRARRLAAESDAVAAQERVRRQTARQDRGLSEPSPALRLAQEHGASLRQLEAIRRDQAQSAIALAQALGGGWKKAE